jgi:hypothetical protein
MSLLLLLACATDYGLTGFCLEPGDGWDIERVSKLQDAAGFPNNRDAVVLSFDDSALKEGESWRVLGVELVAMIPQRYFDSYEGGDVLQVDIWQGERPEGKPDWSVKQAIDPSTLDWSAVTLPDNAYFASQRNELKQQRAWMNFDFEELIPEEGMTGNSYTVGVKWPDNGLPTIGYSNFNLACGKNWTDYGDGSWVLNSADGDGKECSWPMMRVQVETRTLDDGSCTGETVPG